MFIGVPLSLAVHTECAPYSERHVLALIPLLPAVACHFACCSHAESCICWQCRSCASTQSVCALLIASRSCSSCCAARVCWGCCRGFPGLFGFLLVCGCSSLLGVNLCGCCLARFALRLRFYCTLASGPAGGAALVEDQMGSERGI